MLESNADQFKLDHTKLPRSLELTLSSQTITKLQRLADRTGRSIDEVALEILDKALLQPPQSTEDSHTSHCGT